MKTEVRFSPSLGGWNLPVNRKGPQAPAVKLRAKKAKTFRIAPTPEYLGAIREASDAVSRFILDHIAQSHRARTARFVRN
jgi:hypothetical protein